MSRYTGKDFEDEVSVAMDELKNTKSNKRLAKMKSSDFVLYTSSADDFDPQIEMGYSLAWGLIKFTWENALLIFCILIMFYMVI